MTTKYITSYYASGYSIAEGTNLVITGRGGVGPSGIFAPSNSTITNEGFVNGGASFGGIGMNAGGKVTNGSATYRGFIEGRYGIAIVGGAGTVTNFGAIEAIDSYAGFGDGVDLLAAGSVTNGSATDRSALIEGNTGVFIDGGAGLVANQGTIEGLASVGVSLLSGGSVTNGANTNAAALISGYGGVSAGGYTRVVNYGTIRGLDGSTGDAGVALTGGGNITNGSPGDRAALISGAAGVTISGAGGYVSNAGTILATGNEFAVELAAGGALTNGSRVNTGALIEGYAGVFLIGGAATNFATISSTGGYSIGVRLASGATLTNGAANDTAALIEGAYGVYVGGGQTATVINFGTIEGDGGEAIRFNASTDLLEVEAHSTFVGAVLGGGGTLDLASGTGTISGLFAPGGDVTVSGSMAKTTFQNFGVVEGASGTTFTDTGAVTISATQAVIDSGMLSLGAAGKGGGVTNAGLIETAGSGMLTLAGVVTNTGTLAADGGTLVVMGAVTGNGVAKIAGGTLDLASSFAQHVTFTGATGVLELAQSQGYTGSITGFSHTGGTSLDLGDIAFGGATTATYSGSSKSGVLTVTDGTHTAKITLIGNYTKATFTTSSDGHGGTTVVDPNARASGALPTSAAGTVQAFIAAASAMGAGAGASGQAMAAHVSFDAPLTLAAPPRGCLA